MHVNGSCLCGAVRYALDGASLMYHCHCGTCRKANGTAFATNLLAPAAAFEITSGRELLARFESSPGKFRYFCSRCGSPIYSQADATVQTVSIRAGTLDGDPGMRPSMHLHVGSKAVWDDIHDALPQMEGSPTRV